VIKITGIFFHKLEAEKVGPAFFKMFEGMPFIRSGNKGQVRLFRGGDGAVKSAERLRDESKFYPPSNFGGFRHFAEYSTIA